MGASMTWRAAAIAALVVLGGFLTAANFVPKEERVASRFWPDEGLRLGLDLRGGIHWVVGVNLDLAIDRELDFVADSIEEQLEKDGIALGSRSIEDHTLRLLLASEADRDKVVEYADDTNVLDASGEEGLELRYQLSEDWQEDVRDRTMSQVLEVLRRRIDDPQRGIPDSVVTRQGDDRVLVQIPGEQIDRDRARELLKSTGFLEFKIVEDSDNTVDALLARHPEGLGDDREIVTQRDPETEAVQAAYLVPRDPALTGDYLEDARLQFDPQQRPIVEFRFSPQGGELFGKLTEENKNKPLAIILDDNVYSAPMIRARITTRGMIEGRFSAEEAADLAVILRAGSLSVPVVIEEERTVGPGLGQDSIERGALACAVGLIVVLFFAVGYYRLSGGYASVALLANLVLLVGLMSLFEATLTLPGIAGLVLTVGMAVDANVIIFERIREELRAGRAVRAAIATGFSKARWTVLDANITTLITAVILFEYGTGPIKGFAVTLSVGIVTSVFTALVITRLLFDLYPGHRNVPTLSI
ncbi:MAG: protein translocase subunit SecD [Spirochaetaceae bacterium]|nr:protein translocase subunit SecD [Myxococcales bacterium]MCB9726162.1 protein translocase subunit SecD [Spirochaetaceae bacterium]